MRRLSRYRPIAWLAIIALLAQSWLLPLASAATTARLDALTICTGSGFKIIMLPDGAGPRSDDRSDRGDHGGQSLTCTACLVQALCKAGLSFEPDVARWPEPLILAPAVLA